MSVLCEVGQSFVVTQFVLQTVNVALLHIATDYRQSILGTSNSLTILYSTKIGTGLSNGLNP